MSGGARIIAAYDGSAAADDGLMLAQWLAHLLGGDVVLARVMRGASTAVHDRIHHRERRDVILRTRSALAAVADAPQALDLATIEDGDTGRALHELADAEQARFLVLGSTHHGRFGRALLGSTPEIALAGCTCPVAIAPPGQRDAPGLLAPAVSVGYDGSPAAREAMRVGAEIAQATGATLRLVAAVPSVLHRPLPGTGGHNVGRALGSALLEASQYDVPTAVEIAHGRPQQILVEESLRTGLLVMGTHARGPVARTLLGSVATHVLRRSRAPIVLCPPPRRA